MNDILNIIDEYAKLNDIIFGICAAEDLTGFDESIVDIPFFKGSFHDRISPNAFLNGAKSVIVIGIKTDMTPIFKGLEQVMAPSVSGLDYHIRLNAVARELVSKLSEVTQFNYRIQVDTGPLLERAFALKAGLGFKGKNGCVISPVLGSFFNIALIVIDIELDVTLQDTLLSCKSCNKCISACPTKALDNISFEYTKCISYITQKKGDLTQEEMDSMGVSIYGCDICQSVCPYNSSYNIQTKEENILQILTEILQMSSKKYNINFKSSNFFWRGRTIIRRNCWVSMENYSRKRSYFP